MSALDITTGEQVNDSSKTTIMSSTIRRISIAKPSVATPKTSSPFLINQIDMKSSHLSRKSFLNRDSPLLDKIASSSKASGDGENYSNTTKGKGNYVFTVTKKVPVRKQFFSRFSIPVNSVLVHRAEKYWIWPKTLATSTP